MKKRRKKQESQRRSRRKRRWLNRCLSIAGLVAVISLSICVCVARYGFPDPIQAQIDILPDKHARTGTLYAGEMKEVADGDFWVVMNQLPAVEEGTWDCNIQYENPSSNRYSARVSLYLKEDGNLLGNTRRVDPGNYVETIRLGRTLPAGEYPVTAKLELFEEKKPIGTMSIDLTLRVMKQGGDTE